METIFLCLIGLIDKNRVWLLSIIALAGLYGIIWTFVDIWRDAQDLDQHQSLDG